MVQVPTVQRCPAAVRPLDTVGHHQMGVQQRVTFSGGPVVEPHRHQPLSGHVLMSAMTAAGPQVSVQVGGRLADTSMVGVQHRPAGGRVTEAVEDGDALGRPQDHIKGGHRVAAVGAAEQLAGRGVAALEHGLEPGHRCFALQPQRGGGGAVPPARGLTVARQIRFVVGGQLTGVVLLPAHRELGDVGTTRRSLLAVVGVSERTPGALLSSEDLRVERRANGDASSVMAVAVRVVSKVPHSAQGSRVSGS